MPPRTNPMSLGPGLTPREAAADAIYRFTQGLDFADEAMVRSAFVPDAVFDFSGSSTARAAAAAAAAIATANNDNKMPPPTPRKLVRHGIDDILDAALNHIGPMATGHHVSNVRVRMAGADAREAVVTAYAIAQHFPPGQADGSLTRERYTMGNYYAVDVVRDEEGPEEVWRIRRFELSTLWSEGDAGNFMAS